MVYIWSGSAEKYEWSAMIKVFDEKPWLLKVIQFWIGDIKVNDFTFRSRTKLRIARCYRHFVNLQTMRRIRREKRLVYYSQITNIPSNLRRILRYLNLFFFRCKLFAKSAFNKNSQERKRWHRAWCVFYISWFEKYMRAFYNTITWKNFFLVVKEFIRACLRFTLYFFVIHEIIMLQPVQAFLYHNYGDDFLRSDIYNFILYPSFVLQSMYRSFMREHYRRRPSVRLMLFVEYYSRIAFCFIRYRLRIMYYFMRKTNAIWHIEDKMLDLAIKNYLNRLYNIIGAIFIALKSLGLKGCRNFKNKFIGLKSLGLKWYRNLIGKQK